MDINDYDVDSIDECQVNFIKIGKENVSKLIFINSLYCERGTFLSFWIPLLIEQKVIYLINLRCTIISFFFLK